MSTKYIPEHIAEELYQGLAIELQEALRNIEGRVFLPGSSDRTFKSLQAKGYITNKWLSKTLFKKIKKVYSLFEKYREERALLWSTAKVGSRREFGPFLNEDGQPADEFIIADKILYFLLRENWDTKKVLSKIREAGQTFHVSQSEFEKKSESIKKDLTASSVFKEFKKIDQQLIEVIDDLPKKLKNENVKVLEKIAREQNDIAKSSVESAKYAQWAVYIALAALIITAWVNWQTMQTQIHYQKPRFTVSNSINCKAGVALWSDGNFLVSSDTDFGLINLGGSAGPVQYQIISDAIDCWIEGSDGFQENCKGGANILESQAREINFQLRVPKEIDTFDYTVQFEYFDEEYKKTVGPFKFVECRNCKITEPPSQQYNWLLECE